MLVPGLGCAKSTPDRSEMVEALRTSGVPASEARCAVDAIFANLTNEQVRQLVERGAGGTPKDNPARTDDAYDKLTKAMTTCRDQALGAKPTGGPVTGAPTSTPSSADTESDGSNSSGDPALRTATDDGASSTSAPTAGSTENPSSTSQPTTSP